MFFKKIKDLRKRNLEYDKALKDLEISNTKVDTLYNEIKSNLYKIEDLEYDNNQQELLIDSQVEKLSTMKNIILDLLEKNTDEYYQYIFDSLKKYDIDGFFYLSQVQKETGITTSSFYGHFSYEDNIGTFEDMDGYQLAQYYEIMHFANIIDSKFIGSYEKCIYDNKYLKSQEYLDFIKKVKINTIKTIICNL